MKTTNQRVEGEEGEEAEASYTCCGQALDDLAGTITCGYQSRHPHGGLVHARWMLERADHIMRGHVNPCFCVARAL